MSSKGRQTTAGPADGPSKVKAACEECRTRKTKCDGARPSCGRCVSKGRDCVYETEPDEFRITALKRRYTELAQAASSNEALIRLLREKEHGEAADILERLRADESIGSIISASDTGPGDDAERNLMAAVEEVRSSDIVEGPTTSSSSAAEESSPHRSSPQTLVNKQSIAFLVGPQEGAQSPPAPVSPDSASKPSSGAESPPARSPRTRSLDPPLEKRTRTSEPLRPSIRGHTLSAPSIPPMEPGRSSEPLTRRPRSHDRNWAKELEGVKAADWEVYYTDDETFLDILRCYFTWENPSLGFVNEVAFWDGLKNGGSDFCNRPLVHSIVAFGSKIYSMFNPTRAASAMHFALVEVTKLWDWDADATVPANSSTGLLIHAILTSNGQEKDGSTYIAGAMNLALQSALFSKDRISQAYPTSDSKLSRERATWAWNTYAYHGYYTLTFNESLMMSRPPPIGAPSVDPSEDIKDWWPFPLQGVARPILTGSLWRDRAALWHIGSKIRPLHKDFEHDFGSEEHWKKTVPIHEQLSRWRTGLSPRLNTLHGAAPHVFTLHTEYHRCVIDLLRPFVKPPSTEIGEEIAREARKCADESHLQLRFLVHQFHVEFPEMPVPLKMLINPLLYVVNETLSRAANNPEASEDPFYLDLCIKLMCRMQDAYPLMRFLILDIHDIAEREGVVLSEILKGIVKDMRKGRSATLPLNSTYPGNHDPSSSAVEGGHLQRLIGDTQLLSLRRKRTSAGSQEDASMVHGEGGE